MTRLPSASSRTYPRDADLSAVDANGQFVRKANGDARTLRRDHYLDSATLADGSNPTQLTNGAVDRYPVCSPDGKWVYYCDPGGPHYAMRAPLEGGQPEPVPASDVHNMYGFGAGEAISRDGKRLIFQTTRSPYDCDQIFIMNADGSDPHVVSTGKGRTTCAYFLADNRHIVFQSHRTGSDQIFTMLADGSNVKQLTFKGNNTQPNWSWK